MANPPLSQQQFAQTDTLLSPIFDTAQIGICITDDRGYFVRVNQACQQLFGWSAAELVGEHFSRVLPPCMVDCHGYQVGDRSIAATFQTRKEWQVECRDGEIRDVCITNGQLVTPQGECFQVISITDITDVKVAKQAAEQLRRSEELYRTLAKNFPNSTVLLFDKDLRFTLAEGAGLADAGKELLEGRTIWEVFPSEICNVVEPNYRAALAGQALVTEVAYGGRFYSVHSVPVSNQEGEIFAGIAMTQDITEHKQIEAALESRVLERTQQLQQANQQLRVEIAERQRVEAALRESHQQIVTLLESITDAFFTLDSQWKFTYLNHKAEQYLERNQSELLGYSIWQVFPGAIGSSFYTRYHHALTHQVPVTFEEFHPTLNKWFEVRAYPSAAGLSIFFNDITERKSAAVLLEKQKQTLNAILDHAPIWIWMTDTKGQMQFVNKTFCEDVGVPASRFLEAPYAEVLGAEAVAGCLASDAACLSSDIPHQSEESLPFVDSQIHDLEIIKAKIKDAAGEVIGLIGLAVDVTERKSVQRSLQKSEARFRELAQREKLLNCLASQIRNSLDLDTTIDTAVQEIRNLLQIDRCHFAWYQADREEQSWEVVKEAKNSTLSSQLGCYPSAATGLLTEKLLALETIRVDEIEKMPDPIAQQFCLSLGYTSLLALPIETRESTIGAIVCTHCQSLRPWSDSEVELLQAVCDQVAIAIQQADLYTQTREAALQARLQAVELEEAYSRLQRTQTHLVQSEKMSSLGQLVAGVAHEINNPVNFIYGNLMHAQEYTQDLLHLMELYQHEYPNPSAVIAECIEEIELDFLLADLPKLLSSMKVGAERIRQIVQSLRNFSRLDEAARKEVDLHEGLESTLLILQNRFKAKLDTPSITIIKEYGNLPPVECYAGQLNQVFMNLLTNAIDALAEPDSSTQNPEIRISTQVTAANRIRIAIADNGPGIPESAKQRLFDPFFTTKPVGKGTGLGLAISYDIVVEKHGGELKCVSVLGEGTEFIIEIPLQQPSECEAFSSEVQVKG